VRDLLFTNIVLPSNVVARSDERGRIIGAFDVEAKLSVLAFERGYCRGISGKSSARDGDNWGSSLGAIESHLETATEDHREV
jgi:hypothetical protein